jgi:hypothetical protein
MINRRILGYTISGKPIWRSSGLQAVNDATHSYIYLSKWQQINGIVGFF